MRWRATGGAPTIGRLTCGDLPGLDLEVEIVDLPELVECDVRPKVHHRRPDQSLVPTVGLGPPVVDERARRRKKRRERRRRERRQRRGW